jgi:hypothetical protein
MARGVGAEPTVSASKPENGTPADAPEEAVAAVSTALTNGTENGSINVWPDEAAEASFMAEARERGEPVASVSLPAAVKEAVDETDPGHLPSLEELVQRIPAEVREALDDLFRAKFTTVRRLPKKSLNQS